jgi:hypothetical protein
MVFVIMLGMIDMLCAISLIIAVLGFPLPHLQAGSAMMLMFKGFIFIKDVISILDIIAAGCMLYLLWQSSTAIALTIAIYLGFKGIISFV